jgi:hypothetical protein
MSGRDEDNNRVKTTKLNPINGWYLLSLNKLLVDDETTSQIWAQKTKKTLIQGKC